MPSTQNILFLIFLATIFLVLFSLYGFWTAIHPPKFITNLTPKDLGWEYEEVSLTTKDGISLSSWFVPSVNKSDQVIILLHGYPADKANLLYWVEFLHPDFNLFFVDFRYFGNSSGSLTTIGFHEQKDLQVALDYLEDKGFSKTGVMGFSLGGAVAISTASFDERIKSVVSDSAFAKIDLMGHAFYRNLWILKYPLTQLTLFWAQIFLRINVSDSPEKAAQNLQIPVLLIHSQKDATIPFENALLLQRALEQNPKAQTYFLEEGTHGSLPPHLEKEYQKRVAEFFKQNL
mgnify:CR=1 FL=1